MIEYVYVVMGNISGNLICYGMFSDKNVAIQIQKNLIVSDKFCLGKYYVFNQVLER